MRWFIIFIPLLLIVLVMIRRRVRWEVRRWQSEQDEAAFQERLAKERKERRR